MKAISFGACFALLLVISNSISFSRGAVPPPPPDLGLGNAGDWLGSGPIFGMKTPYGNDWPGYSGGTSSFGFDPGDPSSGGTGGNGSEGQEATNCETCRCMRFI